MVIKFITINQPKDVCTCGKGNSKVETVSLNLTIARARARVPGYGGFGGLGPQILPIRQNQALLWGSGIS